MKTKAEKKGKTGAPRGARDTRSRILGAAFQEFYRNGYQGGSLNRIVEEAGTTKGAIFHHFKDKKDLGLAVVREIIRPRIAQMFLEPLKDTDDPVTDLKRSLREFVKAEISQGRLVQGCPLNNLAQEMSPLDEEFRCGIESVYGEWRQSLQEAFARGIKAGKVRKDISPRDVAAFVVAAQAGIIGTAKNSQSEELLKQAGAAFHDYLDGLRTE